MQITAIYLRCSSVTQTNESQRFELEQHVSSHPICGPVRWYEDTAASGADLSRPALNRLQRDIYQGKIGTVIVWKLDRLSRCIADGVRLLSDWVGRGIRIVSITQELDLSGAIGRLVASVLLGVAEMEREFLRERQMAGIARAKAAGVRFGRPRSVDVAAVRRLRDEGQPVAQIARRLSISRQSAYNALKMNGTMNASR
jgi:DNA invertase Pin-like site-specific DNA recombinase